jgi:general secretion pathway protein L
MSATLRLWLAPLAELGADSTLAFEVIDGERRVLERGAAVPGALPRLARTELVIAAPDVLLLDTALPRLSGARQRAALPALAEPLLIGDPEQSFIVSGRPDAAGRSTLAVLDRALFRRALELLKRAGIEPATATPEPLALAATPGRWRLRLGGAYGCLRTGERLGTACSVPEDGRPPVELRLALEQAGAAKPEAIEVEGECDATAWSEALGGPVVAASRDGEQAPPVVLELLQYEFAPGIADWQSWRVPAALAAALALVWIAGLNVDAWLKLREERQLRGQMNAVFRDTFPQVPVVLDPLEQMRRGLAGLRSGAGTGDPGDFLPLAAAFARAAQAGTDAVRQIEYRDRALQVHFEAQVVDAAAERESMARRLAKAGLEVRFADSTLTVRRGAGR